MASKDDSPTSLHGQPWSVWADKLGRDSPLSEFRHIYFSYFLKIILHPKLKIIFEKMN